MRRVQLAVVPICLAGALASVFTSIPATAGELDHRFEIRLRGEAWHAPSGDASRERDYSFGLARARYEIDWGGERWSLRTVLQGAGASGLPERGSFGIGPVYVTANEGETDLLHAGVAEMRLAYRGDGFTVLLGRQSSSEGFESTTGSEYLDGVKRARIAERLLGNWDWVNVGRRYDGAAAGIDGDAIAWRAFALRPLAGGVDHRDAFDRLDALSVYGASATARIGVTPFQELRMGVIRYEDARRGAREAALADIDLTTVMTHWLIGGEVEGRPWDALLWLAIQDGDWGPANHHAWAAIAETGTKLPAWPGEPAMRFGAARASGDGGAAGDHRSFFNLLPTNHKWYGAIDFFAFSNLETVYAQGTASLPGSWRATAELHTFRLADRDGSWWGGSGAFDNERLGYVARRPAGGFSSGHLGEEFDLTLSRPLPGGFALTVGGAYFHGGEAVEEVLPAGADGAWGFVQLLWTR